MMSSSLIPLSVGSGLPFFTFCCSVMDKRLGGSQICLSSNSTFYVTFCKSLNLFEPQFTLLQLRIPISGL